MKSTGRSEAARHRGFATLPKLAVTAGKPVEFDAQSLLGSAPKAGDEAKWIIDGKEYSGEKVSVTWRQAKKTNFLLSRGGRTYEKELLVGVHPNIFSTEPERLDFFYCLVFEHRGRVHFIPLAPNAEADAEFDLNFTSGLAAEVDSNLALTKALTDHQNQVYSCKVLKNPFLNPNHIRKGLYSVFDSEAIYLGKAEAVTSAVGGLIDALDHNLSATTADSMNHAAVFQELANLVRSYDPSAVDTSIGVRFPISAPASPAQELSDWLSGVIGPTYSAGRDFLSDIAGTPVGEPGPNIPYMISYNPHDFNFGVRIGSDIQGFTFQQANAIGDGSEMAFDSFYDRATMSWLASESVTTDVEFTVDAATGTYTSDVGLPRVSKEEMQMGALGDAWDAVTDFVEEVFEAIGETISDAVDTVGEWFSGSDGNAGGKKKPDEAAIKAQRKKLQKATNDVRNARAELEFARKQLAKYEKINNENEKSGEPYFKLRLPYSIGVYEENLAKSLRTLEKEWGALKDMNRGGGVTYPAGPENDPDFFPPPGFWKGWLMSHNSPMAVVSRVAGWVAIYPPDQDFDFDAYAGHILSLDAGLDQLIQPAGPEDEYGYSPDLVWVDSAEDDAPKKKLVSSMAGSFVDARLKAAAERIKRIGLREAEDALFGLAGSATCAEDEAVWPKAGQVCACCCCRHHAHEECC